MSAPRIIISCKGLDQADVLAALYNAAEIRGTGMAWTQFNPATMIKEEAAMRLLASNNNIDYINGRPLKLSFEKFPEMDCGGYDGCQGEGKARMVIGRLKEHQSYVNLQRRNQGSGSGSGSGMGSGSGSGSGSGGGGAGAANKEKKKKKKNRT